MIDHVSIGVRSLDKSSRFYERVLATIGYSKLVTRAHTVGFGARYAEFWINSRPDMPTVGADTGNHVCLRAKSVEAVKSFHAAAIANGGTDDGAPGPRQYSKGSVFAAFIRDPDGNRIEVLTFPEGS